MARSEGAARRRLEAVVSRAAAAAVAVGVASYLLVRTPVPPLAASSAVVTASSPLTPDFDATSEAFRAGRGDALPDADRSPTVAPGRVDLVGLARREDSRVEPFPDVEVEVVRARDGAPVPGAEFVVTLHTHAEVEEIRVQASVEGEAPVEPRRLPRDDGPVKLAGRADEHGRLTIRSAQSFDLAVHASGLGWKTGCIDRDFARTYHELRFELVESLVLDVRVVGPDGAPEPGAAVHAFGIEKTLDFCFHGGCGNPLVEWRTDLGRTGADGRLDEVECARGRRIGFIVGNDEGSWLLPPIALDDAAGARRSVELALPPLVRVAGSVCHPDNTPVERAKLRFERRFDAWSGVDTELYTGDDGRYSGTLEHPGRYRVEFSTTSDEFGWIERETRDVVVTAGTTSVDFVDPDPTTMPPSWEENGEVALSGPVRGKVVGATGSSDPLVEFTRGRAILLRDGDVEACTYLEEDGTFEWKDVVAGDYSLLVIVPGLARFLGETFTLAPESELVLPEVRLAPVPPIRGRVVDSDGRPVEEAVVVFECPGSASHSGAAIQRWEVDSATTNATGNFELGDVGGAGRLYVAADGVLPRVVPLPATGPRDALVLEVPSTRAIAGRVELPGGLPDVKIEISCVSELSESLRRELANGSIRFERVATTSVARDGTFRLPKAPLTAFDLEIWVNTSGWDTVGCVVARRHVPAGAADVELGTWRIASGTK